MDKLHWIQIRQQLHVLNILQSCCRRESWSHGTKERAFNIHPIPRLMLIPGMNTAPAATSNPLSLCIYRFSVWPGFDDGKRVPWEPKMSCPLAEAIWDSYPHCFLALAVAIKCCMASLYFAKNENSSLRILLILRTTQKLKGTLLLLLLMIRILWSMANIIS